MRRLAALLAALQLALPAQPASPAMIAVCGGSAPVPLPLRDKRMPGCKICHSAMRKRSGSPECGDTEEETPDAA